NDAASSGGNRPIYETDAGNNANGRPVLSYDGGDDYMEIPDDGDINTASYSQKTISIAFRTGADVNTRQVIYEQGGGGNGINIYIEGGELYFSAWATSYGWSYIDVNTTGGTMAANTEYTLMFELDIDSQTLSGYLNGSLVGTVATGSEELGPHGGDVGLGAMRNATHFYDGNDNGASGHFFDGDIIEFIYYNYLVNSADKKLIENYLAAKFAGDIETSMADNHFDYKTTFGYEVFGIGQDDTDNNRVVSQGSGIVRVDNPTSMDDGDYLLIGHDNNAFGAWTKVGVPYDSVQRFNRNWIVDETGNVGNVRLSIDTTTITAKPANYESYVVLVDANNDADFDMSTIPGDVTMYPMLTKSGAYRMASSVDFNAGDVFTIGVARNRTIRSGNWNDNSTWLLNSVPGANETAIISDSDTVSLASNVAIGGVIIGTDAVLNLNSQEFTLNGNTYTNNGVINIGTSTFNYGGSVDQCIQPLTYYDLKVSGTGTKSLCGNIQVDNNLLILGLPASLTFDDDGYSIDLTGDWQNTATYSHTNGTVTMTGASQTITRTGATEIFYNLNVLSSGTLNFGSNVQVSNDLIMDGGNINTGSSRLIIGSGVANAGTLTRNSGYIIGELERWIINNTQYEFPIGTTTIYRPVNIQFANVTTGGSIHIGFETTNPGDFGLPKIESSIYVTNTFTEGYWEVNEINAVTFTGGYSVELTANDFTSYTLATGTRVVARPNSLSDWELSGTHVDAVGNVIQRSGITILPSELTVADTAACEVDATITSTDITCNGLTDGTIVLSSASGGGGTYEYSINGGSSWQSGSSFTGLSAATYDVRIRDAASPGCEITLDAAVVITEPAVLNATIGSSNVTCNGEGDGTISLSGASGGSGTYEYTINGGTAWQAAPTFSGLTPATYDVRIRDAGATSCEVVLNGTLVITEPAGLNATVASTNITC
ncbi:MAG: hypothetical protein MI922_10300, partial [Bacteroidales bacterium]|nr:hypothetical protein [Bacteroidales bacterium]